MKVLIVVPTKDGMENEAYKAVLSQDFSDYGVLVSVRRQEKLHDDPEKSRVLNIVRNRNHARAMALASDAEWFLWVDTDVVIPTNTITEFLKHGKKLMGGWYKKIVGEDWVSGKWVTKDVFYCFTEPQKEVARVDMGGLGCAMVHRSVLEKLSFDGAIDTYSKDVHGRVCFLGECIVFCREADKLGSPMHMIPSVICKHLPVNLRTSA